MKFAHLADCHLGSWRQPELRDLNLESFKKAIDISLKENVEFVGEENGHKIYHFNYKGKPERYRGVMAQDVIKYKPEAVLRRADGMLVVDYSVLGLEMTQITEGL